MIRFFLLVLLALIAGAFLPLLLGEDPGYVLITFRGYAVEASLVTALVFMFLLFLSINLVAAVICLPGRLRNRRRQRKS